MSVGWIWPRQMNDTDPMPKGLRLIMEDGTGRIVPCGVLREPRYDRGGVPAWLVVPSENLGPLGRARGGFFVTADDMQLPVRLILDFTSGRGPDDSL